MITDRETNFVYFSSQLKVRMALKEFWQELEKTLQHHNIPYNFIENTSDIWCRDYMPIQIAANEFVQFKYYPSYCDTNKYRHLITDTTQLKLSVPLAGDTLKNPLVIDGGNIVRSSNAVVMTDRIFKENKTIERSTTIDQLKQALQVENIYIIPSQPNEMTGHSDGMVRFLDDHTLLVANYSQELDYWKGRYKNALERTGLRLINFPAVNTEIKNNDGNYTAIGCYINFAWIGNVILFPQFDLPEDEAALKTACDIFKGYKVIPIPCRDLAWDGGVLNCMTWNVSI